jgi:pyruvate,water dikinase
MPVYTRLNATDVLPDPVSPLGATLVWERYIERGWSIGDVEDGCFDIAEIAEPSAASGIFYGHLYVNMSASRMYGIRAGLGTDAVDAMWFGNHPEAPAHVSQPGDDNPTRSEALARFGSWVMTTDSWPALEEQTALANGLRAERPDLAGLSNWGLLTRTRAVLPYEAYAWIGHNQTTKGTGAGPGLLYAMGIDPNLVLTLIGPASDVDSATPAYDLWAFSRTVKENPDLSKLFDNTDAGLLDQLREHAPAFAADFDRFLVRQGFRGPNEWDLGAPSWETHPELALSMVERLRHTADRESPSERRKESERKSAAALEQVLQQFSEPEQQAQIHQALSSARRFFSWRERSKCNCIKIMHEARVPLIELGRRLAADGRIKEPGHVFNALADELDALVAQPESLAETLAARDTVRHQLAEVKIPTFLVGVDPRPDWEELPKKAEIAAESVAVGDVLIGGPGAPGVAQGRVRVVQSTSSIDAFEPGEILVAPQTDPSWTPLFMVSAGVVVDVGSMVSHAMIVSRELGVPCVGGVTDATRRIPDGALVEVDGSSGTVTILELP